MTEWAMWVVPAVSALGAFAGAWGAVRADIEHCKRRLTRVESQVDAVVCARL